MDNPFIPAERCEFLSVLRKALRVVLRGVMFGNELKNI